MTRPLSDEEMASLESSSSGGKKAPLSDDDMAALEAKHTPRARPQVPMIESALRGGAQGLTFDFADEIEGGVRGLRDYAQNDKGLGDSYREAVNKVRQEYDDAQADNPGTYLAGNVAGSLATAAIPGLGAGKLAQGAGLAAKTARGLGAFGKAVTPVAGAAAKELALKGALGGALSGLGVSRQKDGGTMFDSFDHLSNSLEDTAGGAALGAAMPTVLKGLGKAAGAVKDAAKPSRIASVLLGAPEEAVELYLKNKSGVDNALPRSALTERTMGVIDDLKRQVQGGSQASRKILTDEGATVSGDAIADIMQRKADDILQRSEGVVDDPQTAAALNWLRETSEKYRPQTITRGVPPGAEGPAQEILQPRELSTNRVKDILQGIDRTSEYDIGAGKFGRIDDSVKKGVRSEVDDLLKSQSPAYKDQMVGVARDADLLSRSSDLAGSPQAMDGLLKRVERDRAYFPAKTLGELDTRMGTDLLGDLKLSAAKEAFNKSATNGSRNVNLYRGMFGDFGRKTGVPFAEMAGGAAQVPRSISTGPRWPRGWWMPPLPSRKSSARVRASKRSGSLLSPFWTQLNGVTRIWR
jgi:hypothetical protein